LRKTEPFPLRNEEDMHVSSNRVRDLEIQMTQFLKTVELMQLKEDVYRVDISGIIFTGEDDLLVWIEKELPPSYPFGCFIDVYSFLDAGDWG